jgi:hypothetical protein
MITPTEALHGIVDAAFTEGEAAAEVFYRYAPGPLSAEWIEQAQENVVAGVVHPFVNDPHFAQLQEFQNAIRLSAWDGFERRWKQLVKAGPRSDQEIPQEDLEAIEEVAREQGRTG